MKRAYRVLLRLLPADFRDKHRAELERLFEEACAGSRGLRRLLLLPTAGLDVCRARWMLWRESKTRDWASRRNLPVVEHVVLDIQYALRSLRKRWLITLLATTTLGLGIGATTAVFTVVQAIILDELPYRDSDRIVIIWHDMGNGAQSLPALHHFDYLDYRARSELHEEWTIATGRQWILGSDDQAPELVDVGMVAMNFFSFLGVDPILGRHFTSEEDADGGPNVVVLSHGVWQRRHGQNPDIVGKTVQLRGESYEVVGVLPASFRLLLPPEAFLLKDADVWVPTQLDPNSTRARNFTGYTAFARMAEGVGIEQAQQEMERLEAQLKEEHAIHQASNLQVRAVPLHADVVKRARTTLYVLAAAVGLVLLIACGNTAQLLLARWRSGERELSVRAAMGASRLRLLRMVLVESVLLSLAGGLLGVGLARGGVDLLRRFGQASVPRLHSVEIDGAVFGFAVACSLFAAVAFGLVPALAVSRANLRETLHQTGRGGWGVRQTRTRNGLLVGEVAMSVILLVGTGLMVRSFGALLEVDPGFEPRGVLSLRLSLPESQLETDEQEEAFALDLFDRLSELPGVVKVSATSQLPLTGSGPLMPFAYDEETTTNWESVTADRRRVTPDYFDTIGATLLSGRGLRDDDASSDPSPIVIDETLAALAFPGADPIGGQLRIRPVGSDSPFATIVGVVRHIRIHDLTQPVRPQIYSPLSGGRSYSVAIRASGDPSALAPRVSEVIREASPGAALEDVRLLDALVTDARAQSRLSLLLMVAFGGFAVLLAAVGLFGVISYAVSTRRTELGIRIALGASPRRIRRDVLLEGAKLVLLGIPLGFLGAAGLGRLMANLLFGVAPLDPVTYAAVAVTLGAVAMIACWAPARVATRVDPAKVLNAE